MKHRTWLAATMAASLLLAACGGADDPDPADTPDPTDQNGEEATDDRADWPDRLVFGFVPSREADVLVDSIDELAAALSDGLGIEIEPFVSQDYVGLIEAMASDQAQIGAFGPLALVRAVDRAGAEIILKSQRRGTFTYHTQYMTNNPDKYCDDEPQADENGFLWCNGTLEADVGPQGEAAIARIDSTVAFVDPSSASGYLIPALQMIENGVDIDALQTVFAGGHDNSVNAVYNGDVEVGLSFDDARGIVSEELPDVGERVVVFAFSEEIPNDGIVVSGDLPQSLKDAIQQALLDYAATPEGQEILNAIYEIEGLAPADASEYDVMRRADQELGDQFDG